MASKQSKLLAEERRREIARLVRKDGSASIEDLVQHFGVSAVTLRADLGQLARQGSVIRSYGGALLPQPADEGESPLCVKESQNHPEKVRIAAAAIRLLRSRQTVIIDSGSTAAELARAIKNSQLEALTVITHAINIASEFLNCPNISVVMIGGLMRHVSGSFVGPQAEQLLSQFHADHLFLGIDGLDSQLQLSTPDLLEAQLNKVMMRVASQITVIADASKLERRSLSVIGNVSEVQRLITDSRADATFVEKVRSVGVDVITV